LLAWRFHPQVFPIDPIFILASNFVDRRDEGLICAQTADLLPELVTDQHDWVFSHIEPSSWKAPIVVLSYAVWVVRQRKIRAVYLRRIHAVQLEDFLFAHLRDVAVRQGRLQLKGVALIFGRIGDIDIADDLHGYRLTSALQDVVQLSVPIRLFRLLACPVYPNS